MEKIKEKLNKKERVKQMQSNKKVLCYTVYKICKAVNTYLFYVKTKKQKIKRKTTKILENIYKHL